MANEIGGDSTTIANTGSADINFAGKVNEISKVGIEDFLANAVSAATGIKGSMVAKQSLADAGINGGSLFPQLNNNILKNVIQSSADGLKKVAPGQLIEGKNKNAMSTNLGGKGR